MNSPSSRVIPLLLMTLLFPLQAVAAPKVLKIPEGTRFSVAVASRVACDKVKAGDPFNCRVSAPIVVGNTIVVAQGAAAAGSVVYGRGSGVGFGGQLVVSISYIQCVDGSWLPVRVPPQRTHSADNILPDSLSQQVSGGFGKGRNKVLPAGLNFHMYIDDPVLFTLNGNKVTHIHYPEPPAPAGQVVVNVPAGTPVTVHPQSDISSKDHQNGDTIAFVVSAPVVVNNQTVIQLGAPASGTVLLTYPSGVAGGSGLLIVTVDAVQTASGRWLRTRTNSGHEKGDKNTALRLGLGFLVPGGGLVPGKNAVIPATQVSTVSIYRGSNLFLPASGQ